MAVLAPHTLAEAAEFRHGLTMPFIAITGSNGKTTTRSMLSQILRNAGRVYEFSQDSDSAEQIAAELLTIREHYDWAVIKIGAAFPGEIRKAAQLIAPGIAIITNIGEAHLAQYGEIEKIAAAKSDLLASLAPKGIAILNRDNEYTRLMGDDLTCKVVYFGLSPVSDYYADQISHLGPEGTSFCVYKYGQKEIELHLAVFSLGDVYNALAAFAAASELGLGSGIIKAALENKFILPAGRGRMHTFAGVYLLDDTHDATPQSFYKSTKSLVNFRDYALRLIFVMGDLADPLDKKRDAQAMMGYYLAGMPIDIAVLVGSHAAATATAISIAAGTLKSVVECPTLSAAETWLKENIKSGDVILVEGGESIDMGLLVEELVRFGRDRLGDSPDLQKTTHSFENKGRYDS